MTFTAILILNVVLDVAILAALAFVMSRAARLSPHGAERVSASPRPARGAASPRRARLRLSPLLD